MKKVEAVRI